LIFFCLTSFVVEGAAGGLKKFIAILATLTRVSFRKLTIAALPAVFIADMLQTAMGDS